MVEASTIERQNATFACPDDNEKNALSDQSQPVNTKSPRFVKGLALPKKDLNINVMSPAKMYVSPMSKPVSRSLTFLKINPETYNVINKYKVGNPLPYHLPKVKTLSQNMLFIPVINSCDGSSR